MIGREGGEEARERNGGGREGIRVKKGEVIYKLNLIFYCF